MLIRARKRWFTPAKTTEIEYVEEVSIRPNPMNGDEVASTMPPWNLGVKFEYPPYVALSPLTNYRNMLVFGTFVTEGMREGQVACICGSFHGLTEKC
jgi:hypothetical protein